MSVENPESPEMILHYLEDKGYWQQWSLDGELTPKRAAALLPLFLSTLELTAPREETTFWAHRASIFYVNVQWANYAVHHDKWGQQAKFLPWKSFVKYLTQLQPEKRFLFFPGKFRTLPTAGHADTVVNARMWQDNLWKSAESALIFEPKENVGKLEGQRLVFDPQIRSWAYSLMPVDIVTCYPVMQEGEDVDYFYDKRANEIRQAFSGVIGAGIGESQYKEIATQRFKKQSIEVLDTAMKYPTNHILNYDTSELDKISANSEYIEKFILSFLRHTGQISG